MKSLLLKTLIITLFAILLVGCKKTPPPVPTPPPAKPYTYEDFYNEIAGKAEEFKIDAASAVTLTTANGSKISIPENAFVDDKGTPVNGVVTIEYKDFRSKSSKVLNFFPTVRKSTLLHTAAQGTISVYNNMNPYGLELASGKKLEIEIPSDAAPDQLMIPYQMITETGGFFVFWWYADSTRKLSFKPNAYHYTLSRLLTYDNPVDASRRLMSGRTDVFNGYTKTIAKGTANCLGLHPPLYFVFDDYNSVSYAGAYEPTYLPVGAKCTAVSYYWKGEAELYAVFEPLTITEDMDISLELKPITKEEFKTKLAELDK